jgi:hypothetical protein
VLVTVRDNVAVAVGNDGLGLGLGVGKEVVALGVATTAVVGEGGTFSAGVAAGRSVAVPRTGRKIRPKTPKNTNPKIRAIKLRRKFSNITCRSSCCPTP